MALARIGLGSNEGDSQANVASAIVALAELGTVAARSSLYRTRPWGVTEQADFTNAAILLETDLDPHALLHALKALESRLGRRETFRWGPRSIDLDILAYDDLTLRAPDLILPHERLHERAFALAPLAEIDPSYAPAYAALAEAERAAVQRIPATGTRNGTSVNWDETLERVRSAAEFCATAGLTHFRIDEEDFTVDLRRAPRSPQPPELAEAAARPADASAHSVSGNGTVTHEELPKTVLKAEFVGIVRLSRPSVTEGSVLDEDRELAFVESLGIRNPIRSGGAGRVTNVFVTDGQPVEYGQPLFALEK